MKDKPKYYDIRSDFWRQHYESASDYETYLAKSDPSKAKRWRDVEALLPPLGEEECRRLVGHNRRMSVLAYSGIWCGDCVRQGPMLRRIAEACGPQVDLRWIDREASPELTDELRILGAMRVPVTVFFSEDFFEIGRFGDRLLAAYRSKAERELGPACDSGLIPPPAEQLAAEQREWIDIFERMLLMLRLSPMLRDRYGD